MSSFKSIDRIILYTFTLMQPLLVANRSRLAKSIDTITHENRAFLKICGNDNSILSVFCYWKDGVNAQPAVEINIACSESNRGVAPPVTTSNPIFKALKICSDRSSAVKIHQRFSQPIRSEIVIGSNKFIN